METEEGGSGVADMKTKKALGALLGLLGSLAGLLLRPLGAGFSAPLLFTANLPRHKQFTDQQPKNRSTTGSA